MRRRSVWEEKSRKSVFQTLNENLDTDVVIIGGGITGLTTALQLHEHGKSIVLIEARKIGQNTTGLSSCHLTTDIDEEYRNISENFDLTTASVVAESRVSAIDFIEKTSKEKSINCDFKRVPGYLYTEIPEDVSSIKEEFAYAAKAGLDVKLLDAAPLPFSVKKSIRFENQGQFNSISYLEGLASYLASSIRIFENSPVKEVLKESDHFIVQTPRGRIRASQVVMATHLPLFFNVLQTVSAPYISYMLAARLKNKEYAEGLFWDMADPYHYTRYYNIGETDYIVVGGEDHKTGHEKDTTERFRRLEKYVRDRFNISSVDYKWSAQYYQPADGLPYIGKSPFSENIFVATGYSGDGLIYGTIAGLILGDLISGKNNSWHRIYDSTRFTPAVSAADFIKENTDVAKHFIKGRIKTEDEDLSTLKPGEGKTMQLNGEAIAVMRDANNEIRAVSAVCPHMKCTVNWNNFEHSWDCPCHGSRFDKEGKVIYGPATRDLKPKTLAEVEKDDKSQKRE